MQRLYHLHFTLSIKDLTKMLLSLDKFYHSLLISALVSDWVANFAEIMPNMSEVVIPVQKRRSISNN